MKNFNNEAYKNLAADLIGDTFYADTSYRGKLSTVRQYAEVVIRKILDINPDAEITLGDNKIQKKIDTMPHHEYLKTAINIIRGTGNLSTHTKYREILTEEDFKNIIDKLFDLLSYFHIRYFEKYSFGSRNDIMTAFSLLPPIIRYKVLEFLYKEQPNNISVVEKLSLATLKAFNLEEALTWLESEKPHLVKLSPANMYDICKDKLLLLGNHIQARRLYLDFESALPFYMAHGVLEGDDEETREFNDIMSFLFLGRRAISNETAHRNYNNFFRNISESEE